MKQKTKAELRLEAEAAMRSGVEIRRLGTSKKPTKKDGRSYRRNQAPLRLFNGFKPRGSWR